MAKLIRVALHAYLEKERKKRDSFFNDGAVFSGNTPPDLALNHDKYLYGGEESGSTEP